MKKVKYRTDLGLFTSLFEDPSVEVKISTSRSTLNTNEDGIVNYKDALKSLSKKQLIDMITVTPEMAEKCEVELCGGIHINEINGPDGDHHCDGAIEVKTQRWRGKFKLFGRAKFGSVSMSNYERKLKEDELVIVTGFNEKTGQVYYRFKFRFAAIAARYLETVKKSADKQWGNYDAIPLHYKDHPSFEVDFVADRAILQRDEHVFQPKFFKFLLTL